MKIVHLIYSLNIGGAETMLVNIVNEQIRLAEVHLVIINKTYNASLISKIDKGIKVHYFNRSEGSKNPLPLVQLNLLLLNLNPYVIHCHNHKAILALNFILKRKAVYTVHDVGIETTHFHKYKKLFAISKVVKDDINNRTSINANLIYNGILEEEIIKKFKFDNFDPFRVIVISRLIHEKKGQHIAINAIYKLKQKGINNILIDFVGGGHSEKYLKALTDRLELNNQVNFLGAKDHDYINSNLNRYNLLIQPSLFEGFGLTVTESMAAKVPVLVSDIDGPMEIIENGNYGFYFQNNNVDDLAIKIQEIIFLYRTNQIQKIVEDAYQHVKNNFDIKKTSIAYVQSY